MIEHWRRLMRLGFTLSALVHVVLLLAGFVFANARLMEAAPTEAVTVDIVPENEITPKAEEQAKAEEQLKIELPEVRLTDSPERQAAKEEKPAEAQQKSEMRVKEPAKEAAKEAAKPAVPPQKAADRPTEKSADKPASQTASAAPAAASAPPPAQPSSQPDPFAPDATAVPLYLPVVSGLDAFAPNFGVGFDAPADTAAKLSSGDIAAFQAHLQKCWHPPAGGAGADKLRAMLRINLKPNGSLIGEPLLLKASASSYGPALVQTATRALRQCQPFTFLPAEKYQEWKMLDLNFSPRGLAGGS